MPKIRALEVATFYTMFNLAPVGRFHVQLCGTTPCVLRGADKLIKLCHERIGEPLEVTSDGKLSWIEVECLGACVNGAKAHISCGNPSATQVNYDDDEERSPESVTKILDVLEDGKAAKGVAQVDRELPALVGGPATLAEPPLYSAGHRGLRQDQAVS